VLLLGIGREAPSAAGALRADTLNRSPLEQQRVSFAIGGSMRRVYSIARPETGSTWLYETRARTPNSRKLLR